MNKNLNLHSKLDLVHAKVFFFKIKLYPFAAEFYCCYTQEGTTVKGSSDLVYRIQDKRKMFAWMFSSLSRLRHRMNFIFINMSTLQWLNNCIHLPILLLKCFIFLFGLSCEQLFYFNDMKLIYPKNKISYLLTVTHCIYTFM